MLIKRDKIGRLLALSHRTLLYDNKSTYNKRWQASFRYAYSGEPVEEEPSRAGRPEEKLHYDGFYGNFRRDLRKRAGPTLSLYLKRIGRMTSTFDGIFLPSVALISGAFWPVTLGFKAITLFAAGTWYTRLRERSKDPEIEETFLREMIYTHEQLGKYCKVETTHTLDFSVDWIPGFPDADEFPEFSNKIFSKIIRIF